MRGFAAGLKRESVIDLPACFPRRIAGACGKRCLWRRSARGDWSGLDLGESAYFHRELPFYLSQVEKLQPRLQDARRLIADNKVRIESRNADEVEAFVAGSGVEHRVRLTADDARCTCPWYSKHAASRGPCKHILAVRMVVEEDAGV